MERRRIEPGRMTDGHEGSLVVFLIGMRVNAWRRPAAWLPVLRAMPAMLAELSREPARGMLGHRMTVGLDGPLLVQYWVSTTDLMAYAHDPSGEHHPAWRAFNDRARRAGAAVGIWHETYRVAAGGHESVYVGMPSTGLAAATSVLPVARRGQTAAHRLGGVSP